MDTGAVDMAPVGQQLTRASSSTFSSEITGLPLNIPGTLELLTSGINCFPWWYQILRLLNINAIFISFPNYSKIFDFRFWIFDYALPNISTFSHFPIFTFPH
jgi:hypothetical protein